jgi:hypothetical protein
MAAKKRKLVLKQFFRGKLFFYVYRQEMVKNHIKSKNLNFKRWILFFIQKMSLHHR